MIRAPNAYAEARIEEIREAAFRVFVHKGIEAARMQDIADEAGLSAGALYRYFEGKDDLTRRVFESCEAENRELFEHARAASDSPLEALLATGRTAWSWFDADDARERFIVNLESTLASARDPQGFGAQVGGHTVQVVEGLEALVREAQAAGELAADVDARALAVTLLSIHQGLGVLLVSEPPEASDIDAEAVLEILTRMLQAFAPEREG